MSNAFNILANLFDSHKGVFSMENVSKTKQLYSGQSTYQNGPNCDVSKSTQVLYRVIKKDGRDLKPL